MTFTTDDAADAGKFSGEELIIVDEGIVAVEEIPFFAFLGWEFLKKSADLGDNGDEIIELSSGDFVIFEASRPFGRNEETVGPAEGLPDGFGDERSERMEHLENHLEGDFEKRKILVDFLTFQKPVGVFVPDGGIENLNSFGEAIMLEIVLDGFFASGEFATDPVFTKVVGRIRHLKTGLNLAFVDNVGREFLIQDFDSDRGVGVRFVNERLNEAGDIPEFVTEIATGNDGIFGEGLVHTGRAATKNTEAESVGTVFRNHVHGIDDVALALGHFLAVGVEDETVEIDFAEGDFTGDVETYHNHAGDPSKEDVGASFHDVKRVIRIFLAFGPIGTNNGPVGTREPGVKSVFVTVIGDATDFDFGEIDTSVEDPFRSFIGFGLVEHWDSDTPRDLTRNVPIFKTFEVVDENFFLAGRVEFDFAVFEVFNSDSREAFDVDEPLGFEHWFDDSATFIAVGDRVGDFFGATHETGFFEVVEDFLAGF